MANNQIKGCKNMKFNKIVFEDEIIIFENSVPKVINELLKAESELKAKGHTRIRVDVSSNGKYYEDSEHYIVVNGRHEESDSEFLERVKNEKERILSLIKTDYINSLKKEKKSIEKEIRQLEDKYYEYFPDGDFNEEMNKIQ